MKRYFSLSAIFFLIIFCMSCRKKELSSLVDQNEIYMYLRLSYNELYNRSYANARFYLNDIGGDRLILSQNSRVFYNNVELEAPNRKGTNYAVAIDGYQSGGTFDWNDVEGEHYLNTAEIPASIRVDNEYADAWATTWGYDVYWYGDSLGVDEEVVLTLEVNGDTSFTIEVVENRAGENHVHIPAWRMDDLYGFDATMRISRIRYLPIEESPAAGGEIVTSYESEGSWLFSW